MLAVQIGPPPAVPEMTPYERAQAIAALEHEAKGHRQNAATRKHLATLDDHEESPETHLRMAELHETIAQDCLGKADKLR